MNRIDEIISALKRRCRLAPMIGYSEIEQIAPPDMVAELVMEFEKLKAENQELLNYVIEDMRGLCRLCSNGRPYTLGTRNLITCGHIKVKGRATASNFPKCEHFKWKRLEEISY
jgi:hypothetical protein